MYSRRSFACFKHSNFFTVKDPEPKAVFDAANLRTPTQLSAEAGKLEGEANGTQYTPVKGRPRQNRTGWNPTTSFLTATTLIYAIGAGITAAAGTRLALQLILVKGFKFYSLQSRNIGSGPLFLVTTSLNQDWVIYAPAAFLRSGSHFSGSLSGIEP